MKNKFGFKLVNSDPHDDQRIVSLKNVPISDGVGKTYAQAVADLAKKFSEYANELLEDEKANNDKHGELVQITWTEQHSAIVPKKIVPKTTGWAELRSFIERIRFAGLSGKKTLDQVLELNEVADVPFEAKLEGERED